MTHSVWVSTRAPAVKLIQPPAVPPGRLACVWVSVGIL